MIAGAGPWGRILLRSLSDTAGADLVGVATRQADVDALLPPGARRVERWGDLFALAPDGLIAATPAATHAAVALAAIALGIPALVEKPLATDAAAADAVRIAARARQVPILVNHVDLANPAWQSITAAAGPATPGEVIEIEVGGPGPFRSDCSPLWDWGPHAIALALDRLGSAAEVVSACAERGRGAGAAGAVYVAELRRADGALARLRFGSGFEEKRRRAVIRRGSRALTYDDRASDRATVDAGKGPRRIDHPTTSPVVASLQRFIDRLSPADARQAQTDDDLDLAVAVVVRLASLERCLQEP
ncbi:MAG: Gfo/Idh/MocA family oxidoreductase [Alphaproteobacteria bacterium]|nr:Gfo/Idh/MocA family oxidoreductase [Alphaproteobacteria bacterium]